MSSSLTHKIVFEFIRALKKKKTYKKPTCVHLSSFVGIKLIYI